MFVGIDVHKHQHAAALIDERGGELAALVVPNSPQGYRRLLDWLGEHDATDAVIGVESPGSYGRQLVGALAAAGLEVLHVPAWRTHRERHRQGPGKTDPATRSRSPTSCVASAASSARRWSPSSSEH
jgi:transposase